MAIQDIQNLPIEDSFQNLVQVDTSSLEIGTALGATLTNLTLTASFATTASHALNVPDSASFAVSASQATSASFAQNSRNADIAVSSSFSTNAVNAVSASYADYAVSASHEIVKEVSSSYADVAGFAQSVSGNDVQGAVASASYAIFADSATSASFAEDARTADSAGSSISASLSVSSSFAENARTADSATIATSASFAEDARTADSADSATSASFAENARTADNATSSSVAISSSYATNAGASLTAVSSSYALVAGSVAGGIDSASFAFTSSLALRNLLTASNDFSEITFTKGDGSTFLIDATPRQVIEGVKNFSGQVLPKGYPVYVSGSTGNLLNVYPADAGNASKMPATFILEQTLDPLEEGTGILNGFINNVNTTGFADGDTVWVAVGGGYTNVKPTGSALIQKLGNVVVGNSVNGSGVISTQQANDLPNITSGYAWVGNVNQVATAVSTASLLVDNAVSASRAVSASNADSLKQGIDVILNSGSFSYLTADSASFGYVQSVTSSVVITGDAFINLNNDTPVQRYAGIIVQDSGSNTTASLQFDGLNNDWFYEYEGDDPTNFGVVLFGPEYATKGSPSYNTSNTILKSNGGHHVLDSSITDDGSSVVIGNVATFTNGATGSLHGNVTGDLTGNASTATSASFASNAGSSLTAVSASYATTAGSAVSASFAEDARTADNATSASFAEDARTADSATTATNATSASHAESASLSVSSSFAEDARTADSATSASYALVAGSVVSASLAQTASHVDVLVQDVSITGSLELSGSVKGAYQQVARNNDTFSLDVDDYNFFQFTLAGSGASNHISLGSFTNRPNISQTINIRTIQPGAPDTPGTITWDNGIFKFPDGQSFTGSQIGNTTDIFSFVLFDGKYYGTGIENVSTAPDI